MVKLKKKKKGIAVIYVAISMTVILIFAALVIDIGILELNKNRVQNACDAAALAGAKELPADTVKAASAARNYAALNGVDSSYINVRFTESNKKITVIANNRPSDFFFARIVGINQGFASAQASAAVAPLSSCNGLVPFAVVKDAYVFGQPVVLKQAGGDGTGGNYQAVDLDGASGGTVYRDTIVSGCKTYFDVNKSYSIPTEPGAKSGPTRQGLEDRFRDDITGIYDTCTFDQYKANPNDVHFNACPRIVKVPLIETLSGILDVNGRAQITICGFAYFFIDDSYTEGGNVVINGYFIEMVGDGEADSSQTDYKAWGVILTE